MRKPRRKKSAGPFVILLRLAARVTERRFERNQTKARSRAESLNSIVDLKLVVNVRQMKIYRSLRHVQSISRFLAAVTLSNQAQHFDLSLSKPNGPLTRLRPRCAW